MLEDAEIDAIAACLNPIAAQEAASEFPRDRGLGIGSLGYEGQWRNARMHAERIVHLLLERKWTPPA